MGANFLMMLSHQSEGICVLHKPNAAHVTGFDMLICSVYLQVIFKAKGKSRIFNSSPLVMDS